MAKKSGGGGGGNYSDIVKLAAFWALVIAAGLALLVWLFGLFDANLGRLQSALSLISVIMLIIAVGLAAWEFVKSKSQGWKIAYFVALAVWLLSVLFGFFQVGW